MAALPQLDGTIETSTLQSPVTVSRDAHGVPSINAASMEDLFFAQGYVTAQDRLWQMDSFRRYAAGELAAGFGSAFVEQDRHQRLLGLEYVARKAAADLTPRDRSYFEAYARGVNAYINDHHYSLPLEFRVARYFPRAWTVEDSFLVGTMMAEMLTHGDYPRELREEKVLANAGAEIAADLFPTTSGRDLPPQLMARSDQFDVAPSAPNEEATVRRDLQSEIAALLGITPKSFELERLAPGSNNWVLSGAHTQSGKPLLSNDMHLNHHIPNIWYEAHLCSGDFDVAGVSLPGMPAIVVGHNRRIAWGFTNVMPDVQDLYVEQFNDKGEYLTPNGWQKPEIRHEVIRVKRGKDVSMDVVVTRHGPIITPILKGETRQIALRWTIYEPKTMSYPLFDVNAASNWQEFRDAFSRFGIPGQNVVYADVDGHIGYQATGVYPVRNGNGVLPVSGADDVHEWTGHVPFEQLPSVYDPPTGILATANGRITPDGYPYVLSNEWGGPYRTERIYRVLRNEKKFAPADMLVLQTDVQSELDRFIAERIVYAVDRNPKATERVRQAADMLRQFDGRMDKDSATAAIARVARLKLRKRLLEGKLGTLAEKYESWMEPVWLENVVLFQPLRWLPANVSDWNALLTAALQDAVSDSRAPKDLSKWKYGDTFPIEVQHPIFARIPVLNRLSSTGALPQSGDGDTVKQVGRAFGPSERFTADLSNLDGSTLNIVNGQSGNLLSPYFNDQWTAWYRGTTFPLPFSAEAVNSARRHELTLKPAK